VSSDAAYEGDMNEVALFKSALRAALPTQPDRRMRADLVPRLAQIARSASIEAEQARARRTSPRARRRPRRALVARVAIAVALVPLLFAGLAVAGVTVPEPARSAFETVGVELPNQPDESSRGGDEGPLGPGSATGQDQKAGKAKGKSKTHDPSKPGRRVRRHGEGPLPGPASPPEGYAYGQTDGAESAARGNSQGKAGLGSGRGQGRVHGMGLSK
jgi:hypothetical protein